MDSLNSTISKIISKVQELQNSSVNAVYMLQDLTTDQFTIDEEFVADVRKILTDTITLAAQTNEIYGCRDFSDMISTLTDWHNKLDNKCSNNEVYTEFLEKNSKKLLELGKTQIEAWPKIKTALKKYEDEQKKSSCIDEAAALAQSQKDEQYSQTYKEFISDVEEFLQINSMFGKEEDSVNSLMQAYNDHAKNSNLSPERKAEEYVHVIASFLLREGITLIMDVIISPVEDRVKKLDVHNFILHFTSFIFKKAVDLERQQYAEDEKFKEIEDMFSSFSVLLKNPLKYDILKLVLDQDKFALQKKIEDRNRRLIWDYIALIYHDRKSYSGIKLYKNVKANLNNLVRYNTSVMTLLFKVVNVNDSTHYINDIESVLFHKFNPKNTRLQIAAEELSEEDILNWLGIKVSSSPNIDVDANPSTFSLQKVMETVDDGLNGQFKCISVSEFIKHMQIGLDEDSQTRKTHIKSLLQVLQNIAKIFFVACKASGLPKEKYLKLVESLVINIELVKGLCYAEKINHLKTSLDCKAPPYALYAAKFMTKPYTNSYREYPALDEYNNRIFRHITASSFF